MDRADDAESQTVVIVDDRVTNLRILERLAASMDNRLSILTFDNPLDALDAIAARTPDLVITDFKMPGIDGAEFIRRIRLGSTSADVPVIVVTAYEDKDLRYQALNAGATDFLLSPVDHQEFRARSRNLLLLRQQQLLLKQRTLSLEQQIRIEAEAHQQALRRSHDLLLRVIDIVPVMISAVDSGGRFLFANESLREFLGKKNEDLIGRTPIMAFPGDHAQSAMTIDQAMLANGESFRQFEEEVASAAGEIRVLLTTKSVVSGQAGNGPLVVTVSLDITDRKESERSLIAAKELAEVGSRTKTEFLANMSHELRTPLNAIIGFSHLMAGEMLGPIGTQRYLEYASDINHSAKHLLAIINDILDVSKLEAGKLEPSEEMLDLSRLTEEVIHLVDDHARSHEVVVRTTGFDQPIGFRGDDRMIRQILLNLLTNAIKFSRPQGEIMVSADRRADGLAIAIADQGVGMDPAEIEIAVTRFGQVGSTWSRRQHGTGLGLPLAIGMVELHDGRTEITSRKGHGTTVTILFPAVRLTS